MPRSKISIDSLPVSSAGAVALYLITAADWESTPPRLWSTTRREIAETCRVSVTAVSKWLNGTATPTVELQAALERHFHIPSSWWRDAAPPTDSPELLPMAWLLGLAKPDAEHRLKLRDTFGIPIEDWDQPVAVSA